ncbi:MAG: KH domain-containing protein [Candidatus Hydrothermarchaeota archaeon]|nr:KH domain-containing protein [Candidatus Hydrothermarchaeota archaeon]
MEYVRIPMDRVGVLIGKGGEVRKEIEDRLKVKLNIDAEEGIVTAENQGEDVLAEWKARDVIRAIGKGLNPSKAMKLCSDDYALEIIELEDFVGRSKKALLRQKGRIIGRQGKTRKYIEDMTKASISVFGKGAAIVGTLDEVQVAREAIVMLARGMPHSVVYKFLQRKARELKEKRLSLWR